MYVEAQPKKSNNGVTHFPCDSLTVETAGPRPYIVLKAKEKNLDFDFIK
jgi:hypothetical protein